jgi:hypothetical protein
LSSEKGQKAKETALPKIMASCELNSCRWIDGYFNECFDKPWVLEA